MEANEQTFDRSRAAARIGRAMRGLSLAIYPCSFDVAEVIFVGPDPDAAQGEKSS